MKLQYKILATAVILAASATTAYAEPFKMDTGKDIDTALNTYGSLVWFKDSNTYAGDGGGAGNQAAPANFVNFNPNATSVYTQTGSFTPGILKNGDVLSFTDAGSVPVSSFNNAATTLLANLSSLEGFGTTWGMHIDYSVSGTAVASITAASGAPINMTLVPQGAVFAPGEGLLPTFAPGGTFKFFIDNFGPVAGDAATTLPAALPTGTQVLELYLQTGAVAIANLHLEGVVDYSGAWTSNALARDFFKFADGTSFYSLWAAGQAPTWNIDSNVEPNLIPRAATFGSNYPNGGTPGTCPAGKFCRTTLLNMDAEFQRVPEPDMTLMMGAGIMGLGFATAKRRRKQLAV